MSLGVELKLARVRCGVKAKDLAPKVGITAKYLSQIEQDKAPGVTAAILKRLCEELQVSADQLLELPDYAGMERG